MVEPANLRPQHQHVIEDQQDADGQNAEDQAVEPGIVQEGDLGLTEKDGHDETDDDQKKNHRPEEGHRA